MKGNLFKKMTIKMEEKKIEESKFLDPKTNKFSYESLKNECHEGMDPTKKEAYLTDEEFAVVFGMTTEKFYEQKKWKQQEVRKAKGLF